jgi:hypothetical protein
VHGRCHYLLVLSVLSLTLLAWPPRSMAQSATLGIGGGYHFTSVADEAFPVGWHADIAANLRRSPLWLVAEASGAYDVRSITSGNIRTRTATRFHNFFFGLRWKHPDNARSQPYAQALIGRLHASATDTFETLMPGGIPTPRGPFEFRDVGAGALIGAGVTMPLSTRAAARAGFDYCVTMFESHEFDGRIIRLSAGMMWAFGPR